MIAEIFYPILTLKIKIVRGFAPTPSPGLHQASLGGGGLGGDGGVSQVPLEGGFAKNRGAHIFSVLSPVTDYRTANTIHGFRDSDPVLKIHGCY